MIEVDKMASSYHWLVGLVKMSFVNVDYLNVSILTICFQNCSVSKMSFEGMGLIYQTLNSPVLYDQNIFVYYLLSKRFIVGKSITNK